MLTWLCAAMLLTLAQDQDSPPLDPRVGAILDRWESSVGQLDHFTCRFKQEKKVPFVVKPQKSEGEIRYAEGRLLWISRKPHELFMSIDDREMRMYTPAFGKLEIYSLKGRSGEQMGVPGLTTDPKQLREHYFVKLVPLRTGEKGHRLHFTPRLEDLKQKISTLEVLLDDEYTIRGWDMLEPDGDELSLTIDRIKRRKLKDEELRFEVPADVEVIRFGADGRKSKNDQQA